MFLSKRKKTYCLNCQYPLTSNYNYCPNCGQENDDKLVSFNTLIGEFFQNYFAYDSRFFRTIKPFLFKPGFLTIEFVQGRRNKYMHPLRLYFIISFIYFFLFSFMVTHNIEDDQRRVLDMEEKHSSNLQHKKGSKDKLDDSDLLLTANDSLETDSISIQLGTNKNKYKKNKIKILLKEDVTPIEVLDTLEMQHTTLNAFIAKQGIRLANESKGTLINYLIKNASIMMFLLLPFFALIIKLFYIRRSRFYIEHLTFALHIHAFLFFMSTILMAINFFWPNNLFDVIAALVIMLYFIFAFKNMYQQKWAKTLIKFLLLFFTYSITFSIFLIITTVISFLLL